MRRGGVGGSLRGPPRPMRVSAGLERAPSRILIVQTAIRIKTVTPQRLVAVPVRTTAFEIGAALADALARVWSHLARQERVTVGPAIARYLRTDADDILLEAGFATAESPPVESPFVIRELPGGPAATMIVHGSYAQLPAAFEELEAWMGANGHTAAEPPWEIYWVDSSHAASEAELRTELVWPIRDRGAAGSAADRRAPRQGA